MRKSLRTGTMLIMRIRVEPPARSGSTEVPGGRRLAWAEWGPSEGTPVLLCPGAATSRSLGFGADVVDELGIRLISLDRPGLGASDPAPGRTLGDFAEDVRHLATVESWGGLRVVGFSQGAPFALACAALGVVEAAAVVSGTDELAAPEFADRLLPEVRRIVDAVAAEPAETETSFAEAGGADRMWELITSGLDTVDKEVYGRPDFETAFRRALDEGFAQGGDGYARDTVLAFGRWPFALADIVVPVALWYGAEDTSPTHSPDFGATLAQRIPSAQRHLVPEAGGALLWTHAEPVLRSVLEPTHG